MVFATLLTTVLLALTVQDQVAADPIPVKRSLVTLPISRRINLNGINVLENDQLRAKALKAKGELEARAAGTPLTDRASEISSHAENRGVAYIASIGVGSPATQCKRL
jgi:cathepsin E